MRQVPGEQLAARATAEDERFELCRCSHAFLQVRRCFLSTVTSSRHLTDADSYGRVSELAHRTPLEPTPSTGTPPLVANIERRLRRRSRARCARVFAVPTGIPRASATSAIDNPSTSRRTMAAR